MTTFVRIAIEAPDAATALTLERRLTHLHPVSIGRAEGWIVEFDDDEDRLDEVVAAVKHWLRDFDLVGTELHVDGVTRHIDLLDHPSLPLGSEYDAGPVLTHEP